MKNTLIMNVELFTLHQNAMYFDDKGMMTSEQFEISSAKEFIEKHQNLEKIIVNDGGGFLRLFANNKFISTNGKEVPVTFIIKN